MKRSFLLALCTLPGLVWPFACSSTKEGDGDLDASIVDARIADAADLIADARDQTVPDGGTAREDAAEAPEPPVAGALTGLTLFEGWNDPRELAAPVTTSGWEDSSFIAPDGRTLYFAYTRYDFTRLFTATELLVSGPDRAGQKGDAFDIYEAVISTASWDVANSTVNSAIPALPEGAQSVTRDGRTMIFAAFDGPGELFSATRSGGRWDGAARLSETVNSTCSEDNPHISADGRTLWFDSDRREAGCAEPTRIFESRNVDGVWTAPVLVVGAPNAAPGGWQPFVTADGTEFYWTLDNDIVKTTRQADGTWGSTASVVIRSSPWDTRGAVISVGEVSITEDRRFLYFTYIYCVEPGSYEVSIGVARR